MPKEKPIEVIGEVEECLPNVMYRVRLENGVLILCQANGNMRRNYIKVLVGDKVKIEISPYDLTRGRITSRL